jgi:hypothetical protein
MVTTRTDYTAQAVAAAYSVLLELGHLLFVADFDELDDPEERELRQRDAYERVNYLIDRLGIRT